MIKRTLFFSKPYRLSVKYKQLVAEPKGTGETKTIPVEDIGFVVLEHQQINISLPLIEELINNNVAIIFCNNTHYPSSMLLNLNGHHLQQTLFSKQINATQPLKKQLWKTTIVSKIENQATLLSKLNKDHKKVMYHASQVKSNDADNREGAAARAYWPELFGKSFIRGRYGIPPNNLLNYIYAILRAAVARALTGSGLLATLGIHHSNKYNAFCLADDIMEPYRPFADKIVFDLWNTKETQELTKEIKMELLKVLTSDVIIRDKRKPLMVALTSTSASLAKCFEENTNKIVYPKWDI